MMIFDSDSSILVLFCRKPSLGNGKQRIAAEIGGALALEISELLLSAAVADAQHWSGPVVVAPASPEDQNWAAELLPGATVIPQSAGNLGERIGHVDECIRAAGGRKVIFIGSDAPGLSPELIKQAADNLEDSDVVLMPADDGGVTLMGSRVAWPRLPTLAWGSAKLCSELTTACINASLSIALQPGNFDIDICADLLRELGRLEADPRKSRNDIAQWVHSNLQATPELSIIIPVLNDLPALEQLLIHLTAMQAPGTEIIVSDGGGNPDCKQLCDAHAAIYLPATACRGRQLVLGAKHSSGDILWFLHADSEPVDNSVALIRAHIKAGHSGGFFSFHFLGKPCWQKSLLEYAINLRTRMGIPYGDQGLFATREAYLKSGGFDNTPLFEEVRLVRNLRKHGGFKRLSAPIGVSPRRWERDGWLTRTFQNRWLALAHFFGVPAERLTHRYKSLGRAD
jgi:rSAM/selenodomain-associated transferase 2